MNTLRNLALVAASLAVGTTCLAAERQVPTDTLDALGLGGLTEMPEAEANQVRGRWASFRSINWGNIHSSTDTGNGYVLRGLTIYQQDLRSP